MAWLVQGTTPAGDFWCGTDGANGAHTGWRCGQCQPWTQPPASGCPSRGLRPPTCRLLPETIETLLVWLLPPVRHHPTGSCANGGGTGPETVCCPSLPPPGASCAQTDARLGSAPHFRAQSTGQVPRAPWSRVGRPRHHPLSRCAGFLPRVVRLMQCRTSWVEFAALQRQRWWLGRRERVQKPPMEQGRRQLHRSRRWEQAPVPSSTHCRFQPQCWRRHLHLHLHLHRQWRLHLHLHLHWHRHRHRHRHRHLRQYWHLRHRHHHRYGRQVCRSPRTAPPAAAAAPSTRRCPTRRFQAAPRGFPRAASCAGSALRTARRCGGRCAPQGQPRRRATCCRGLAPRKLATGFPGQSTRRTSWTGPRPSEKCCSAPGTGWASGRFPVLVPPAATCWRRFGARRAPLAGVGLLHWTTALLWAAAARTPGHAGSGANG